MYVILSGTTDYFPQLMHFLSNNVKGFSMFEGKGSWQNKNLAAQLIILFNESDAAKTQDFLKIWCGQKEVEILKFTPTSITT
jgi:hypothetical protein